MDRTNAVKENVLVGGRHETFQTYWRCPTNENDDRLLVRIQGRELDLFSRL